MLGGSTSTTSTTSGMTSNTNTANSSSKMEEALPVQVFNCSLCQTSFKDNKEQRAHMKSAWHVYNLKRRVASLPPLTQDIFNEVILTSNSAANQPPHTFSAECSACEKEFDDPKAYQNHLKSQNHLRNVPWYERREIEKTLRESNVPGNELQFLAEMSSLLEHMELDEAYEGRDYERILAAEEEERGESGEYWFHETLCIFCDRPSDYLHENMAHMEEKHGFKVPAQESLISLESLLSYLHTLITEFQECISCGRTRSSVEAIRAHMRDASHCRIDIDDPESELLEFYDFDGENEDEDERGEFESKSKGKEKVDLKTLVKDENGLSLPCGRVLGHRSRRHIYRQHLSSPETRPKRLAITDSDSASTSAPSEAQTSDTRLVHQPRGSMGLIGLSDVERKAVMIAERKIIKTGMRASNEYRAGLEKRGNKQKHFKNDVPGPKLG